MISCLRVRPAALLAFLLLGFFGLYASVRAEEPLPPEQAFRLSARMLDGQTALVRYDIVRGYYMYRDKFGFEAPPARLGAPTLPPGTVKDDPNFGVVETYRDAVEIKVPVHQTVAGTIPAVLRLKATSQGCADLGICYPPQEQFVELKLAAVSGSGGTDAGPGAAISEEASILAVLKGSSFWGVVLSFFGAGLLLAFTPCMLPMIPILSGIVIGGKETATRGRAVLLSLTYVAGMAISYAAAGIAAGLTGSMLTAALQSAWVLGGFALLFVVLACSMFGLYELQLPSGMQSWLTARSNQLRGGQLLGVFLMGVLSALIIGPCVAPPLAAALLFIAERGDVALGGSALFAMALGMGVPLVGVGVSAGSLLPRAGPWMQSVKNAFGVVLLGVAIWIISPLIPAVVQMLAWGVLLIVSAVYLRAIDLLPSNASGMCKLWKGVGLVALIVGAAMLLGALSGSRDVLQPLSALRLGAPGAQTPTPAPEFERIATVEALHARIAAAKGTPIMVDFYADWCVSCKEMERFTFSDRQVQARMRQFVLLRADVTANDDADKALLKRFSLFGPPGIVFFDRDGREIKDERVIGFKPAARFAPVLDRVLR